VTAQSRKLLYVLAGLAYLVWPYDLIPDFIKPLGYIDDLLVILYLYRRYHRNMPAAHRSATHKEHIGGSGRQEQTQQEKPSDQESEPLNPYQVLGVSKESTPEEIEKGYKTLAAKYHPDKVNHLGQEFQQLAHQRMIEIQRAYEALRVRHR